MQDLLKSLDLSTTQFRALAVLTVASGITVNELAVFAVTEQSTMSRTLDALEEQELIRRRPKPGDMRVREVFITEQGLALFAGIWPDIYGLYARFFDGIDEAEFRGFMATLHKILRNTRGGERRPPTVKRGQRPRGQLRGRQPAPDGAVARPHRHPAGVRLSARLNCVRRSPGSLDREPARATVPA